VYDGDYKLTRLLFAAAEHNVRDLAPKEFKVSEQIAEQLQREPEPGYYYVPFDRERLFNRDLTAGIAGAGVISSGQRPRRATCSSARFSRGSAHGSRRRAQ
jgi:hypothetical protein